MLFLEVVPKDGLIRNLQWRNYLSDCYYKTWSSSQRDGRPDLSFERLMDSELPRDSYQQTNFAFRWQSIYLPTLQIPLLLQVLTVLYLPDSVTPAPPSPTMATNDLQILHPDSARVHLNSRGFVKIERVAQSTTEPATDVPWLTTTGPPTEEIYLARVTAGNLEELATALRCQRDGDTQLYEVAIRAVPASSSSSVVAPTPSQTPEYSINSAEHCENDDSIDSDELLVTSLRQKLRKKKRGK